jgi:uncharacterized RDD family membrane protein YckC
MKGSIGNVVRYFPIETPEGVSLVFEVSTAGDRMLAFFIDFAIITAATLAVYLLAAFSFAGMGFSGAETATAVALIIGFVIRQFYFAIAELRSFGTTIGKRKMKLRVVSRDGGPLTAEMIIARNLTRDLEFFLPMIALAAPESVISSGGGVVRALALVWMFVFALMPLFGKFRLRVGDLISGTVVVRQPETSLLKDLASKTSSPKNRELEADFFFTKEQLDLYGIAELQVLEDLMRRREEGRADRDVVAAVCERIKKKIGWTDTNGLRDTVPFLQEFYKAQRAHLEKKMLLGERKEKKTKGRLRRPW